MKKLISLILALIMIAACLSGVSFAADAEASYTVGTTTKEGTLAEAVKAVSSKGGTIKLLKDVNNTNAKASYAIACTQSFTLDLNGHTVKSVTRGISVSSKATGKTVIKNGKIISDKICVNASGGGLTMQNVEAWCATQQNIAIYDKTGNYNTMNLIEGCTFANPVWGALAFNSTEGSMARTSMLVRNSTFINSKKGGGSAVVIQGKAVSSNLVLAEGVKMMSFSTGSTTVQSAIKVSGEKLTKQEAKASVTVCGNKLEGLSVWATPAQATGADITVKDTPVQTGPDCSYTAGGETKTGSLADAAKAINAAGGGTVKLLRDVYFMNDKASYAISTKVSFTLDLNGKTLNSSVRGVGIGKEATGVTVIKNGTIVSEKICANVEGGGLKVQNVTMWCNTQQCIGVYDTTGKWNGSNIIENSVLANPVWGSLAFNNSSSMEKYSMTVKNSTLINSAAAGGSAVVIQKKAVAATMNVGEGVKFMSFSKGETTIQSGIKVTGTKLAKAAEKENIKVADYELKNLFVWMDAEEVAAAARAAVEPADYTLIPEKPQTEGAEAGWFVRGKTKEVKEGTLADAVAAVSTAGGAIRLYKDVNHTDAKVSYAIDMTASFTLDLNGHDIKSVTRAIHITTSKFAGTSLIIDSKGTGIIESELLNLNAYGGIQLKNLRMWSQTQQNIAYYDTTGKFNGQNVIEDCVIVNPVWGALAFNNTGGTMEKTAITIRNSILANTKKSGGNAVVIQSKAVNGNLILAEGVQFMSYSTGATSYAASAVYCFGEPVAKQAAKGAVTIGENTAEGMTIWSTPAKPTVKPMENAADGKEVQYTVDGVKHIGTMKEAAAAVSAKGGTVKLLADYYHTDFTKSYAISSAQSFTLDLNGFTLYSVTRGVEVTSKATGTTVIIDTTGGGLMNCQRLNANISAGGLHVNNVVMWSQVQQNIAYYDTTGEFNDKNIIENSVIANPAWGALAFNKSASMELTSMTVKNSTLANVKSSNAVVMQSKAIAPTLVLGEGVKFMTMNKDAVMAGIKVTGKELTKVRITSKNAAEGTLEIAGKTYEKMAVYATEEPLIPPVLPIISIDCAYTVNGVTQEGPIADAMKAVSPAGGTITMLKDYTYMDAARTFAMVSDSAFTLDLAGHTIKSVGHGISVTGKGKVGTTVITDSVGGGAIIADGICVSVTAGGLHVKNATMWSNVQQNIAYYDVTGAYNAQNIIEGSTLGNPAWGAISFNNTKASMENASFTVKNSTLVNGFKKGGDAIVAQSRAKGANVVLGEGVKLMSYDTDGSAILPIVKTTGEAISMAKETGSVEIAGKQLTGLSVWTTAAKQ